MRQLACVVRVVLGIIALVGGISYFVPPLWDHDAWKKFAGIDMPDYPTILTRSLGVVTSNAVGLVLIFVSIYLLFVAPARRRIKQLERSMAALTGSTGGAGTTFMNCRFYGTNAIPPPSVDEPSQVTGTTLRHD